MRIIVTTLALTVVIFADEARIEKPAAPEQPVEIVEIPAFFYGQPSGDKQVDEARQLVFQKIALKLTPKRALFSRSAVLMTVPAYDPVQIVEKEKRLPFTIKAPMDPEKTLVSGYVRLSDKEILILDTETKKYVPYTQDPRFPAIVEPDAAQPAPKKAKTRT